MVGAVCPVPAAQPDSPHRAAAERYLCREPYGRAAAIEALGYLRYDRDFVGLSNALNDTSPEVRREAALALGWCGGRAAVPELLEALQDPDWSVRQAAWVALTNLTGMEFPFDGLAPADSRAEQSTVWKRWWATVPPNGPPAEVLDLLGSGMGRRDFAQSCAITASSMYKGPVSVLTDPAQSKFWQTKQVPFPQHCTLDLGAPRQVGCVVVEQYGRGFCMTDYELAVSGDGRSFESVCRRQAPVTATLVIGFEPVKTRFVRVISHATENPTYPTTFYSVRVFAEKPDQTALSRPEARCERALRALGVFGGVEHVIAAIKPYVVKGARSVPEKLMVQAGIRSLGRLGGPEARRLLVDSLQNTHWARYAADALGDVGDSESAAALIAAYPPYAMTVTRKKPAKIPGDDRPGFEAVDRMYETPYAFAEGLSRCDLTGSNVVTGLRAIAPLLVANLPGDYDGAILYEPEACHEVTGYLLDAAGVRREVCEIVLTAAGAPGQGGTAPILEAEARAGLLKLAKSAPGGVPLGAAWLAALCRDKGFVPRLVGLLSCDDGWVRLNAAKALAFIGNVSAAKPIGDILAASKSEAEHGYFGGFRYKTKKQGQDEYNAPTPCWRESFVRALGILKSKEHVQLLVTLLNDESSVLDVRYAAIVALDAIGTPEAQLAMVFAEDQHPFHSVRLYAREALWRRGTDRYIATAEAPPAALRARKRASANSGNPPMEFVFIRGSNNMPNDFQIDHWRQTYSTTDSGPTYRLGTNLCVLAVDGTNRSVRPLTRFEDGYVADCEVSWDGKRVVFARREQDNPWWHICEVQVDGGGLWQLTDGPYHDVQPAYLPDGRIVFASSRTGMRDEYHGYPATGLTVMNANGSGIRCIGFNLGRDNEPAVLPDGRIVFSRLELFYSRLKTELTVQAVFPDGTGNVTLYGPERRDFWRGITRKSGERWWGEAPPRHRVLRLTQPQPYGESQVICATTGGATLVGPGRHDERIVPRPGNMAITSPFPLDDGRVLCAASVRTMKRAQVNLGLYFLDVETGDVTLLYDDPRTAEFEARPIAARPRPPVLPDKVRGDAYTGRLMCSSARVSQEALTRGRAKLVRIVEGQPVTGRHFTHTSKGGFAWKNHVGTHARVLGTVPLAADGSFYVEIPADRLVHCQVLDSDRRVVGNQLIWMYARPGETKSCVGCHEFPDTTPVTARVSQSARTAPLKCLPTGGEFSYRAKAWRKGTLPEEAEERTRTVRAVNLPGRL
jgi:HEAT repeat protein